MDQNLVVKANPAKSFFVSMLIKDITLRDAIGDLVDNAVDAIKACAEDKENLSGYKVMSQYNQIGNAVPPLMAKKIAEKIADYLNKHTQS